MMGIKLSKMTNQDGSFYGWMFECPGCKSWHVCDSRWTFNGDEVKPTFDGSVLCRSKYGDPPTDRVCHLYVRDGKIEYLSDCTHEMAGQTIDMPDWESSDVGEGSGPETS